MAFQQRRSTAVGVITISAQAPVVIALTGVQANSAIDNFIVAGLISIGSVAAATGVGFVQVPAVNTQTVVDAFRVDLLTAKHAFGASVARVSTTADTFKMALFLATASRGAADVSYTTTGEVSGTNYTAGGVAVTNGVAPTSSGPIAYWTPSASIVYTNVTLATPFDAMLLYNNTSVAKLAIAVFTFGAQIITAADFTVAMPVNDSSTGLIRLT